LPEATTRRLSDHARSAGLEAPAIERTELLQKEGDPFTLAVRRGRDAATTHSGVVQEAPAAIRQFIEDLQNLRQPLASVRPSSAYIRSEPIAADRLRRLEKGGKVRLLQVSEFPAETRTLLLAALQEPLVFFSLNPEQYQQLLARTSHGRDFFVVERTKGHQLTLFQTESQQPPNK
jgi:hypothetical protein